MTIRIAAALVHDGKGRLLLVRKAGTRFFMQPGGKIERDESPTAALRREIGEELRVSIAPDDCRHLGSATAPAANEAGQTVCAELFSVLLTGPFAIGAEIAEAVWVVPQAARCLPLAPLTSDHVLALADNL